VGSALCVDGMAVQPNDRVAFFEREPKRWGEVVDESNIRLD